MDFVGPLPRSSSGRSFLLVFVDKFSKWVELVPLRSATSASVITALRERIIYRFGCPSVVISDNGSQFVSKSVENFLSKCGIQHRLTAPYTPQENPTERVNRVIKTLIAQNTEGNHRRWDVPLAEIAFAINTASHDTTKTSPAEILFGRNLKPPNQIFEEGEVPTGSVVLRERGPKEWNNIIEIMKRASKKQQRYYNLRRREWHPKVGEKVFQRNHTLSSAISHFAGKLAPKYCGPYEIIGKISSNIYILQTNTGKTNRAHVQDLKPYHERESHREE